MNPRIGKSIPNNVAIRIRYENALAQLVLQMRRDTDAEMRRVFRNNHTITIDAKGDKNVSTRAKLAIAALLLKFRLLFSDVGRKAAVNMVASSNLYTTTAVRSNLESITGKKIPEVTRLARAGKLTRQSSIAENESLLNSIPEQYFTGITAEAMGAIATGLTAEVEQAIEKKGDVAQRRAKNIAIDQTNKVTQALVMQKMIHQGVKKFQWVYTYRSKEPRRYHIKRGGVIYDIDRPPGGEYPGIPINCKCVMRPVL